MHYGGDSGNTVSYRKGTLHFYQNTVVSTRSGNTTLVRLSSPDETVDARNNVIYVSAAGTSLAITGGDGNALLRNNWLPTGWRPTHDVLIGSVQDLGNITDADPGFTNVAMQNFSLAQGSSCIDGAGALSAEASSYPTTLQIATPTVLVARPVDTTSDIGAFER
jgi:hypothetical protein